MLTLFICMAVGFVLCKTKILPDSATKVMAKLEVWVFCPALSFYTMAKYCTADELGEHATNVIMGVILIALLLSLAYLLARLFVRENVYERNVYKYGIAFANIGYVGDPVVESVLGGSGLASYKIFTLPFSILIYTWGVSVLVPKDKKVKKNPLINLINAPTIALLLGMIVGLTGLGSIIMSNADGETFFGSTLSALKGCMGPVAMLLAGCTVASYPIKKLLGNFKIYLVTILRLIIIPVVAIAFVFALKVLAEVAFNLAIDNMVLHLAFFATGTPLGLNTVVFPEAYGGDPSTGAGMAMVSHTLCVVSIPLLYALLNVLFPI